MNAVLAPQFAPMNVEDIGAVTAIESRIYPFPWTRGNFADSLRSGYSAWVLKEGGTLIGYALMMLVQDEVQLLNIGIAPEHQGLGLGSALLQHLCLVARRYGATRMFLEVRPSNVAALALYRHHGFVEIGVRRGYYPMNDGREDALVLAREL